MSADVVSADVVSAEKAQQVIDAVNAACELGDMSSDEEAAALTMESLARTVLTLGRELAVLRAQLPPLCAVHDALVAAAALPGAGASPEAMVAAVRVRGAREMLTAVDALLDAALRHHSARERNMRLPLEERGAAWERAAAVESARAAIRALPLDAPGGES